MEHLTRMAAEPEGLTQRNAGPLHDGRGDLTRTATSIKRPAPRRASIAA